MNSHTPTPCCRIGFSLTFSGRIPIKGEGKLRRGVVRIASLLAQISRRGLCLTASHCTFLPPGRWRPQKLRDMTRTEDRRMNDERKKFNFSYSVSIGGAVQGLRRLTRGLWCSQRPGFGCASCHVHDFWSHRPQDRCFWSKL